MPSFYGFPHFRFFQTFISHGLLVTAAVYLTTVEGMRPTWRSMLRVIVFANVFMVVVFGVNSLIGSNYLYVNRKPLGPTLLDVLPEWPVYLIFMELIGFLMFLLLYLPFIIKDWRSKKQQLKSTVN
ncbi:MAG: TIGR02206 family membrane protein [Pelolinea sp.]|nr:TIGR02206 family membrane protein [Pelolinea sp.]